MDETNNHNLENINDIFKIPIFYNDKVKKLNENIVNELELVKSIEKNENSIYENVFKPNNKLSSKVIEQFAHYYTTDTDYLKKTQTFIQSLNQDELNTIHNKHGFCDYETNNIVSLWEEIKSESSFCEKYLYIDWAFAKELNNNSSFLQLMSIYNIASPIISLCLPIIVLIIPFFVIKVRGIELSVTQYIEILKSLIAGHSIFKIFTQFHQVSTSQKIYLLVTSAFYLFSIYQNILICIRFYSNMQKIHNYLAKFKQYLGYTLDIIDYYSLKTNELTNFTKFKEILDKNKTVLVRFYKELNKITPLSFSLNKMREIGHIMYTFYQLYNNPDYNSAIIYSFGFNGYFNIIEQTSGNVYDSKLIKAKFTNSLSKPVFKKMYYPKFINDNSTNIIKNDCNLNKNMVITGPNASGKTTTLKTTLINLILSQQIGFGCFESLKFSPYDNFHCYINIPDTSGRDSLFQAEARRCKEIIDIIDNNDDEDEDRLEKHFCIFDELYSGTNPEEAVVSAFAFMKYIMKHDNVTCLLTTHYIKLCNKLSKNKRIQNYNMRTNKNSNGFQYTYLLEKGISKIKGGLQVLKDMNYPKEILDNTN